MAFATEEEKFPLLRRILQGLEDTITQRKLKLKSSRLRKAQEQIKNILHGDALDSLHQDCKTALLRRQNLLTSKTISALEKESEQIKKDLEELKKEKNLVDSRWSLLHEEHRKTQEKIEDLKKELEENILELTGKVVDILLE